MSTLSGHVALVTGASRGLGKAIALALAGAGADVAVNYRVQAEAAESVAQSIRALGRKVIVVQGDVSLSADVERVVSTTQKQLGAVAPFPLAAGAMETGLPALAKFAGVALAMSETVPICTTVGCGFLRTSSS